MLSNGTFDVISLTKNFLACHLALKSRTAEFDHRRFLLKNDGTKDTAPREVRKLETWLL